jgi:hypothetical protein
MITPHPTSRIDPLLARGVCGAMVPATATRPAHVTFLVPNTNYELFLRPASDAAPQPGKRLIGMIAVEARRIDVVQTGGQYIEPVTGRPRRMQGTVVAVHNGALVVDVGTTVHCTPTDPRQSAGDFKPGQFIAFEVKDAAVFTAS